MWTGTELRETQVCRFISNIISRVSRAGRAASRWEKGSGAAGQPRAGVEGTEAWGPALLPPP